MTKNTTLKKLLNATLLGAVCTAPLVGGIAATAAPQNRDQGAQARKDNKNPHSSRQHTNNQSHNPNQSRPNNQNHTSNQPRPNNQNHNQNQSRPTHLDQNKNWSHRNNNRQDDAWHTNHGYTRSGSTWLWHGHDDAWWSNNGYQWNGTIWILLNHDTANYGPFQTFMGVVTKVHGNHGFNLRVGATTYHIYSSQNLPGNLNVGDIVRAYGQSYGNNVIRNANFSIVSNR